jgi:hypothetical protein
VVWHLRYTDPFGTGTARPYLVLRVVGPDGASESVPGVVDSGADNTCLPLGYAPLLGYGDEDLEQRPMTQASGTATCHVARRPSTAWVVGLEARPFEVRPTFIDHALNALWGRSGLFQAFAIVFDEPAQRFSLIVPD